MIRQEKMQIIYLHTTKYGRALLGKKKIMEEH